MPVSAEADCHNGGDFFTFSPVSIESYTRSLQQQQQQQQQHYSTESPPHQQYPYQSSAGTKRKFSASSSFSDTSFDNYDHVSQSLNHVSPSLNHVSSNVNHVSPNLNHVSPNLDHVSPNLNHVSPNNLNHLSYRQQQLLTPPQTPVSQFPYTWQQPEPGHAGHVPSKIRRILPRLEAASPSPELMAGYQHHTVSVNGVGFKIHYPSVANSNSNYNTINSNKNCSPGLNFLYEKSLNNARRWRENGLTVQLFYCIVCQFPADDEERMKRHIETFHIQSVTGGQLQCRQCGDTCSTEDTFLQHSAAHYQDNRVCKGCGAECSDEGSLREHEGECYECRPHRCEYCNKGFLISARVKHHRQTCSAGPEPPTFTCKVCSKTFHEKHKYVEHVPIHAYM